ncbi:MAG: AhpC/TSA family protein [Candidatus Rokubacteria bacterium]|nr:AhpC/TSA family protein [Candidatus Rokubacteria bacterium]
MTTTPPRPIQPGDRAPGFSLPAINREGAVSLDEYRGKQPVLVGLFRGLHCPFCRRHLVQLSATQEKLKPAGVETLGVVNTTLESARLYFKYRPTKMPLAADPEASTHRAYGVPEFQVADTSQWPYRREGIVRWAHIEGQEGISDFGKALPEAEILAAACSLPR